MEMAVGKKKKLAPWWMSFIISTLFFHFFILEQTKIK